MSRQRPRYVSYALTAAATAPRAATALIVHQKSGGTVMFAFKEKPVLTYRSSDGITYLVVSEGQESVSYPFPDVQKLTFDDVADDMITRITAPTGAAPQPTYIYNVSGMLVRTLQPSDDDNTSASLEGLPAGTYIVKNGTTSYKIIKR